LKELLSTITGPAWQKIGIRSHHGLNLPLSALRSSRSSGIGEFLDLLPLIDWCQSLKIDFIQLLPLNCSGEDASPYNLLSSCALNPIYISLHALPFLQELPELKWELEKFAVYNQTKRIAYADVRKRKLDWLRAYFIAAHTKLLNTKEAQEFVVKQPWVKKYSEFKTRQDRYPGISSQNWPNAPLPQEETSFYFFLQFLCFTQLTQVKTYANSHNVFLMGDLPFLMNRESADAWSFPELFDFTLSGGAPPDAYNKEGQDWGSPIYQWEEMRSQKFAWWKQRLGCAEHYFDLFRLDHALGFFRVWGIPPNALPKQGHFVPQEENRWEEQGRELLSMIATSTSMLPIAEDLGTVPPIVRPCLHSLGICGTKVMRWERRWEEDKGYIPIQDYPPDSITCLTTHDMQPLAQWWKETPEEAEVFAQFKKWTYSPILLPQQREAILWDSHHTASLFHVNLLQEYLALFPDLTWEQPEEERINIPGKVLPTNWTYRFRPSIEEIVSNGQLFLKMEKILHGEYPF